MRARDGASEVYTKTRDQLVPDPIKPPLSVICRIDRKLKKGQIKRSRMSLQRCEIAQARAVQAVSEMADPVLSKRHCSERARQRLYWGTTTACLYPRKAQSPNTSSRNFCFRCIAQKTLPHPVYLVLSPTKVLRIEDVIKNLASRKQLVPLDVVASLVDQFGIGSLLAVAMPANSQQVYVSVTRAIDRLVAQYGVVETAGHYFVCQSSPEESVLVITRPLWAILCAVPRVTEKKTARAIWVTGVQNEVPRALLLTLVARSVGGAGVDVTPRSTARYALMALLFSRWNVSHDVLLPILQCFLSTKIGHRAKPAALLLLRRHVPHLVGPVPMKHTKSVRLSGTAMSAIYRCAAVCLCQGSREEAWSLLTCWEEIPTTPCPDLRTSVSDDIAFEKFLCGFGEETDLGSYFPLYDGWPMHGLTTHSGTPCYGTSLGLPTHPCPLQGKRRHLPG